MVSKLNANRQPGEAFGAAMGRIYKDIGFGGLWNGLVIRIFMIGTLTSLRKSTHQSLVPRNADKLFRMGHIRQLQDIYGVPYNRRRRSAAEANGKPLKMELEEEGYLGRSFRRYKLENCRCVCGM